MPVLKEEREKVRKPRKEKEPVRYEWVCRWTVTLRALLLSIEDTVKLWVEAENMYRSKLGVVEKKDMKKEQYYHLNEKDHITMYLERVVAGLPSLCLHG